MSTAKTVGIRLAERLQAITLEAGYHTNMGLAVYRGALQIAADVQQSITLVEISESGTQTPTRHSAMYKATQLYAIAGLAVCDPDNPNDVAHDMLADIKRAIFAPLDPTLGGVAMDLRYITKAIGPRDQGSDMVSATVQIEVDYVEDLTAP